MVGFLSQNKVCPLANKVFQMNDNIQLKLDVQEDAHAETSTSSFGLWGFLVISHQPTSKIRLLHKCLQCALIHVYICDMEDLQCSPVYICS